MLVGLFEETYTLRFFVVVVVVVVDVFVVDVDVVDCRSKQV